MPPAYPVALQKAHLALVPLGLCAIAAYLQAIALNQLVAAGMTTPRHHAALVGASTKSSTGTASSTKSAKPILARNVFDSTTGPIAAKAKATTSAPELANPLSAAVCQGTRTFIVTESADPGWSTATLQGPDDSMPVLRRIGDSMTGKKVAYIGYNPRYRQPSVWLQGATGVCQAPLFGGVAEAAAPVSSDSETRVDRAVLAQPQSEREKLFRSVRAVPEMEGGEVIGVRLLGIRPDSLLGTLGLKNGDRLQSINGFNLTSMEKALEAYVRLRTAERLKVQLVREERPMTIVYEIR